MKADLLSFFCEAVTTEAAVVETGAVVVEEVTVVTEGVLEPLTALL